MSRRYVLDVDTGIDDALAILVALGSGVEVAAIGVCGANTALEQCVTNTLRVLRVAGAGRVPVGAGARSSRSGRPFSGGTHVQGADAFGGVSAEWDAPDPSAALAADAAEVMAAGIEAGATTLVATAPLTNVAELQERFPAQYARLDRIVWMGGTVRSPGNVSAVAEANCGNDPEAANAVLGGSVPVTVVPLDVTTTVLLTEQRRRQWARRGPAARFAAAVTERYIASYLQRGGEGCFLHDPLAMVVAVAPDAVRERGRYPAAVETAGAHARGQLIVDRRRVLREESAWPMAEVVERVDAAAVLRRIESALARLDDTPDAGPGTSRA